MLISSINNVNLSFKAQTDNKKSEIEIKENKEKKINNSTKVLITFASAAALLGITYFAGKKHLWGDKVYNLLNKNVQTTVPEVIETAQDKIGYSIKPPIYDSAIKLGKDESGYRIYTDIVENMRKDANTNQRLVEISKNMSEDMSAILDRVSQITGTEKVSVPSDGSIFHIDIAKKRFFSLPQNKQAGYSCVDPLLYQASREEIVDLNIGYRLLEELNEQKESRLLNSLRQFYSQEIGEQDGKFLNDCVSKLLPENAKCYGKKSVLHSSDLSRVGRIFRKIMDLSVR